jgi:hypothetical protein
MQKAKGKTGKAKPRTPKNLAEKNAMQKAKGKTGKAKPRAGGVIETSI